MQLQLAFNLTFEDLNSHLGLTRIDEIFSNYLKSQDLALYDEFLSYRAGNLAEAKTQSEFLINCAKILEGFLFQLFNLPHPESAYVDEKLIAHCHRNFVQRVALRRYKSAEEIIGFDYQAFRRNFDDKSFIIDFARDVLNTEKLDDYAKYAAAAHYLGIDDHFMFKAPQKYEDGKYIDFEFDEAGHIYSSHIRNRPGFNLTDEGGKIDFIIDQVNYCIYCHKQEKDSCSNGLKDQEGDFKKSSGDVILAGCPLEEKISEMNFLKFNGYNLAAFAVAIRDNPMIAATGHRICNDCMKSCIYQKQEPVNIPEIETNVLKELLSLPWGFEIYNLLTLWNPLQQEDYILKEDSGSKILVVGLGPAGFTLCHYLSKMGHDVFAIDGLKIEPFDNNLLQPIYKIEEQFEELSTRVADGFGGVMEYGITNRWNKNYLKVIRIILQRRKNIKIQGGIRFGSNITPAQAKELGFDHVAICSGAGKPHLLDIKNGFARGVRSASDFLMSLQLTGAANQESISNLQIRMPIVVIGGGLTAVDTATEALAYYPIQVEKFLQRYEKYGEQLILDEEERIIADEFITHAKLIREERAKEKVDLIGLLGSFGGVKILYRKAIGQSPAYRNNHEEVELALQEGIKIAEHIIPLAVKLDNFGHIEGVDASYKGQMDLHFPAKTMLIAAGTAPNTTLAEEYADFFALDGKYFRLIDEKGNEHVAEKCTKPKENFFLTYKEESGFGISFLGDAHPSYAGNVVKAMASAKNSYKYISELMAKRIYQSGFLDFIQTQLVSKVLKVNILAENIIELVIHSPLAAKNFKPGQFFKLQNYVKNKAYKSFAMEPLAMTGAMADPSSGLISLIILEMGGSSSLCRYLAPGEEVVLMGPTGKATDIKANENVILIGGGLGNAVLFSIGKEIKRKGGKVTYFAAYRNQESIFKREEIENSADIVIWCCEDQLIQEVGNKHFTFKGNIVQALQYYYSIQGNIFDQADKVITIGSDKMMSAVKELLLAKRAAQHKVSCQFIASINSPMQCMMKEICGQCIQRHYDEETQTEYFVFSCVNQDQDITFVDFTHLADRLKINSLSEKITALFIKNSQQPNHQLS